MGSCHSKKQSQLKINIIFPSGKQKIFIVNPEDSIQNLLQQIFEDVPITAIDDKIIPGQQLLVSQTNPKNILKFSEEQLLHLEIMSNETFMLMKTELELSTPKYQNYFL